MTNQHDQPSLTPALRVSPTEPKTIRAELERLVCTRGADGIKGQVRSDWTPEARGVDYMWIDAAGFWRGVQRKEVSDFIASLDDGRLAREIAQMLAEVVMPVIVIEGQVQFAGSGGDAALVTKWGKGGGNRITRASWQRRLLSIMDRGVQVMWSKGMSDTAAQIAEYWRWSQVEGHTTGTSRPGPAQDWGRATNRDWQVHLLCGLDGVGVKLANRLLDELGYCPIQVSATKEELMSVKGVGGKMADRILAVNTVRGSEGGGESGGA